MKFPEGKTQNALFKRQYFCLAQRKVSTSEYSYSIQKRNVSENPKDITITNYDSDETRCAIKKKTQIKQQRIDNITCASSNIDTKGTKHSTKFNEARNSLESTVQFQN